MTRLICLTLLIANTQISAQDRIALPDARTLHGLQLPAKTQSVYTIQYNIQLQNRVMPDSTVLTDTMLSKSKECNYIFNEDGDMLSEQVDSFDEKGKIVESSTVRYTYGEKGRIACVTYFRNSKMTDSIYLGS